MKKMISIGSIFSILLLYSCRNESVDYDDLEAMKMEKKESTITSPMNNQATDTDEDGGGKPKVKERHDW